MITQYIHTREDFKAALDGINAARQWAYRQSRLDLAENPGDGHRIHIERTAILERAAVNACAVINKWFAEGYGLPNRKRRQSERVASSIRFWLALPLQDAMSMPVSPARMRHVKERAPIQ